MTDHGEVRSKQMLEAFEAMHTIGEQLYACISQAEAATSSDEGAEAYGAAVTALANLRAAVTNAATTARKLVAEGKVPEEMAKSLEDAAREDSDMFRAATEKLEGLHERYGAQVSAAKPSTR